MSFSPNEPLRFTTCRCQHCSGGIEFEVKGFEKGETRLVECPHCQLETIIFVRSQNMPPKISVSPVTSDEDFGLSSKRELTQAEKARLREMYELARRLFFLVMGASKI